MTSVTHLSQAAVVLGFGNASHDRGGVYVLAFVIPLALVVAAFFIAGMRHRDRD